MWVLSKIDYICIYWRSIYHYCRNFYVDVACLLFVETGSSNIDLSSLNRQSKIFCIIAEKCGPDIRYVLHFLVPYTILKTWFLNKPSDVVNRTVTTLKQWIFKMKKNDATWWRIQAVLKFLRREDVIQAIVGEK